MMTRFRLFSLILLCGLATIAVAGAARISSGILGQSGSALALVADGSISADITPVPDWHYDGDQDGDEVGYAVAAAGDLDADGYDDVVVGARHDSAGVNKEGVVYGFWGRYLGLGDIPDWTFGSGEPGSQFGAAVGTAGDVNNDGYDDLIVGAPGYKNEQAQAGAAFVFYGPILETTASANWSFVSDQKGSDLGISVGAAGDVNGDGYDDVIVGARWYYNGELNEGAAFVFYGSGSGLSQGYDWFVEGGQVGARFGASVSTAGDVNGDGYDDVIVGAPLYDGGQQDEGAVFLFYGSDGGLNSDPDWIAGGEQEGAEFGTSVGAAGDVNGDGYGDIIVGAPYYDAAEEGEGAAFLFYGSDAGLSAGPGWRATSGQSSAQFGVSVGAAGDLNNDGYSDVIVGASLYEDDQNQEGAAFVFHGSARGLHGLASWRADGDKHETGFGLAVGTAGDVNRDDYDDLLVGAPSYFVETAKYGRAFGYYGPIEVPSFYAHYLPLVVCGLP